jgi:hypothetical protein
MIRGSTSIGMVLRALVAGMFLLLASWQPGLAAAVWANGDSRAAAVSADHQHDGASASHDHEVPQIAGDQHQGQSGSHHQPASLDLCCEMHCVMSQAMPASSPVIRAPAAGGFRADFAHALPDGQISSVIKPPRTTS